MKSLDLLSIGLYLAVAFLAGCSSLPGLPVDLKDECAFYQQTLGLRYERVNEVSSQLKESLMSFTTNRIEGFDFKNEISTFVLKNQFDVYRVYWYRQRVKNHGDYVRADFVEDGMLIQWSSRVSRDPGDSKDEEEFVDAEGNHIFDLGPHRLKISDGGKRYGFSRTSRKSFSTEYTKVVLNYGTLFVNGLSYGKLSDGDEIFIDHGTVFISGKKTPGWIPDEYEWRWLYPETWNPDSTYLNDRLVLYCWKESMSRGKTWFGRAAGLAGHCAQQHAHSVERSGVVGAAENVDGSSLLVVAITCSVAVVQRASSPPTEQDAPSTINRIARCSLPARLR